MKYILEDIDFLGWSQKDMLEVLKKYKGVEFSRSLQKEKNGSRNSQKL